MGLQEVGTEDGRDLPSLSPVALSACLEVSLPGVNP